MAKKNRFCVTCGHDCHHDKDCEYKNDSQGIFDCMEEIGSHDCACQKDNSEYHQTDSGKEE